jgi:hypothetical protein
MTLVAVWKATEDKLMAIADTRISRSVGNILTEHGPKLLPLSIVCRQPGAGHLFDKVVYRNDIGFAYSGSTLSALAAHILANTLISNLISNTGTAPPSLIEVAFAIAGISADYIKEVGQLCGPDSQFRAIVFGNCPQQKKLRVFLLSPALNAGSVVVQVVEKQLEVITLDSTAAASVVIIGSASDQLNEAIDCKLALSKSVGDHEIMALDMPKRALQQMIDDTSIESVGGSIQQAEATSDGFKIIANVLPITPTPPSNRNAGMFVLGFDTFDMQQVGSHMIAFDGRI